MNVEMDTMTVRQIVDDFKNKHIWVNPEYQRGEVWSPFQQKKLIDSLLRGYKLPIFYLHEITQSNSRGDVWRTHEIIDGQQRCNALDRFINGDLQLLNVTDPNSRFPVFLRDTEQYPCSWSGKHFNTLEDELKSNLLDAKLPVAFISDTDENEVRDLFIRLQSGSALNEQEKRDAYPGEFTEFILKLGGKPSLNLNGYDFFTQIMRMKPGTDRGKTRQLAAQISVLFLERRKNGLDFISDANSSKIWEYYDTQLNFNGSSPDCQLLLQIIQKLEVLLKGWKGPRILAHNAISLVLFLDSIWDYYAPSWEKAFAGALGQFEKHYSEGKKANEDGEYHPAWQEYGQYARTNADSSASIRRRQNYFTARMVEYLGDSLIPLDTQRLFNDVEKRYMYWRDSGDCQVCRMPTQWENSEFHHVILHKDGGKTVVENGALVHLFCHPKSASDVKEFADKWFAQNPDYRNKAT